MTEQNDHTTLIALLQQNHALLEENKVLIAENNELLHKQEKRAQLTLTLKVVWYAVLLGIPMLAYYFLYHSFLGGLSDVNTNSLNTDNLKQIIDIYTGQQ